MENPDTAFITSLSLYTNRGRMLVAQASQRSVSGDGKAKISSRDFKSVKTTYLDTNITNGTLKGFFGSTSDDVDMAGIQGLGFIWGDVLNAALKSNDPQAETEALCGTIAYSQNVKGQKLTFSRTLTRQPELLMSIGYTTSPVSAGRCYTGLCFGAWNPKVTTTDLIVDLEVDSHADNLTSADQRRYNWLTLPTNDYGIDNGYISAGRDSGAYHERNRKETYNVKFTRKYSKMPRSPLVAINRISFVERDSSTDFKMMTKISNLSTEGFDFTVEAYEGSMLPAVGFEWLTWDQKFNSKIVVHRRTWGNGELNHNDNRNEELVCKGAVAVFPMINGIEIKTEPPQSKSFSAEIVGTAPNLKVVYGANGIIGLRKLDIAVVAFV